MYLSLCECQELALLFSLKGIWRSASVYIPNFMNANILFFSEILGYLSSKQHIVIWFILIFLINLVGVIEKIFEHS